MGSLLGHKCGVVGVLLKKEAAAQGGADPTPRAAELARSAMIALQHRGEQCCGIAAARPLKGNKWDSKCEKGIGPVHSVFSPERARGLGGILALGHVRFPTTGEPDLRNAHPFHYSSTRFGPLALVHNGDVDRDFLDQELISDLGHCADNTSDTGLLAPFLIARRLQGEKKAKKPPSLRDTLKMRLPRLRGSYCLVLYAQGVLYAVRDPYGYHPMVYACDGDRLVVASETCALDALGFPVGTWREIPPGHLLEASSTDPALVKPTLAISSPQHAGSPRQIPGLPAAGERRCQYELAFFARSDSRVFGIEAHGFRQRLGQELATEDHAKADRVRTLFPHTLIVDDQEADVRTRYLDAVATTLSESFDLDPNVFENLRERMRKAAEDRLDTKVEIQDALRGLARGNAQPELIILDWTFANAEAGGREFLRKFQELKIEQRSLPPVVILSNEKRESIIDQLGKLCLPGEDWSGITVLNKESDDDKAPDGYDRLAEYLTPVVIPLGPELFAPALGYSRYTGYPLVEGLFFNRFLGRPELEGDERRREEMLRQQMFAIESALNHRNVILLQHSIIHHDITRMAIERIVDKAKQSQEQGNWRLENISKARIRVHLRVAFPPFLNACSFGVAMPKKKDLRRGGDQFAAEMTAKYSQNFVGIEYLSPAGLKKVRREPEFAPRDLPMGVKPDSKRNAQWCPICTTDLVGNMRKEPPPGLWTEPEMRDSYRHWIMQDFDPSDWPPPPNP
ncbi:MAG: hypothetical protein HZA54_10055 [Planctomycetes bacterium]|nr:hypothetical protein [Planctomycetota bacterium]